MAKSRRTNRVNHYNYAHEADDFDPIAYALLMGSTMVNSARFARREYAVNHRGFLVGASVLANSIDHQEVVFGLGWNHTLKSGDSKFCAEMRTTQTTKKYPRKEAIVVVGPDDPEKIKGVNEKGIVTATLVPCKPCREGTHVHDAELIMTLSEDGDRMQAWAGVDAINSIFTQDPGADRRRRRTDSVPPMQPDVIDFTGHAGTFWGRAFYEYVQLREAISAATEHELRLARVQAGVAALYAAAPA